MSESDDAFEEPCTNECDRGVRRLGNDSIGDGVFTDSTCSFYTKVQGFRLTDLLVERHCNRPLLLLLPLPPSP